MRVDAWETRLKLVIEKHLQLPARYGLSDCLIIALDGCEAVLGEDPYPRNLYDREYSDAQGALRCMVKAGFTNVRDLLAAKFPNIPPSMAQRGDVGITLIDDLPTAGLFTQFGFMTRGEDRVLFLSHTQVKEAFKVG